MKDVHVYLLGIDKPIKVKYEDFYPIAGGQYVKIKRKNKDICYPFWRIDRWEYISDKEDKND